MTANLSDVYLEKGKAVMFMRGHHDVNFAQICANKLMDAFTTIGPGEIVVDLTDATGFDTDARKHWQGRLKELAPFVRTVTLVNGPPLMRMAATAVCLYAGVKLRTVGSLSDAFLDGAPQRAG